MAPRRAYIFGGVVGVPGNDGAIVRGIPSLADIMGWWMSDGGLF